MRATVSRVARKHIYRAVGRSVREGLNTSTGRSSPFTSAPLPPLARSAQSSAGGLFMNFAEWGFSDIPDSRVTLGADRARVL